MKNPFRRPTTTHPAVPSGPAFSQGDTQPISVGSWHPAQADATVVLAAGRPRRGRRLIAGVAVGAVAGIGLAFSVPALADSGATGASTSSPTEASVAGGGSAGGADSASGDAPAAGTGATTCPAPPAPPAPHVEGGIPQPPAEGELPVPAAPPAGGEVPAPSAEGEVPVPRAGGEVPAPSVEDCGPLGPGSATCDATEGAPLPPADGPGTPREAPTMRDEAVPAPAA